MNKGGKGEGQGAGGGGGVSSRLRGKRHHERGSTDRSPRSEALQQFNAKHIKC
jgi:hypothetical protein